MAASLIGIMALVCRNISANTAASQAMPPSIHKPQEITTAAVAP